MCVFLCFLLRTEVGASPSVFCPSGAAPEKPDVLQLALRVSEFLLEKSISKPARQGLEAELHRRCFGKLLIFQNKDPHVLGANSGD